MARHKDMLLLQKKLGHIVRFHYKTKNPKNAKITKDEDEFAFAMQHEAHLRSTCKCIMDLEATKHMIVHRMTFNTYKVIFQRNVRLGDKIVDKATRVRSIVVGVETRRKTNRIHITNVLHVPKRQANSLSVSKLLSKMLKVQLLINECIVRGANGDVVVKYKHERICSK